MLISASSFAQKNPSPPQDLSDVVITLERTPCFGSCPVYSVTIRGDGRVEYIGKKFVRLTGRQDINVPVYKIQELVQQFYDIDYFSMKDVYKSKSYEVIDLKTGKKEMMTEFISDQPLLHLHSVKGRTKKSKIITMLPES